MTLTSDLEIGSGHPPVTGNISINSEDYRSMHSLVIDRKSCGQLTDRLTCA